MKRKIRITYAAVGVLAGAFCTTVGVIGLAMGVHGGFTALAIGVPTVLYESWRLNRLTKPQTTSA